MKRKNGFYWVCDIRGNWLVAEFFLGNWFIPGVEVAYNRDYFKHIDERKIERL